MSEQNSPLFRFGMIHGTYDAARPPRLRRGYSASYARSWMYRRGFARGFLAAKRPFREAKECPVCDL